MFITKELRESSLLKSLGNHNTKELRECSLLKSSDILIVSLGSLGAMAVYTLLYISTQLVCYF